MRATSANAKSEVQREKYLGIKKMKGLLEVMSLEVPTESGGTVTGVQSWRRRVTDFMRCDREAMSA